MPNKASMSITLGLPAVPEVDTAELYAALTTVYNSMRSLGYALDTYTGNTPVDPADYPYINYIASAQLGKGAVIYVKLTEDVVRGSTLNLHNASGLRGRLAQSTTKPAHCFALVAGVADETIPVCLMGLCSYIGGLVPGAYYYQSATAGQITSTVTSQKLGVALGPNHLWFTPS